jgi:diguanylate cyclase (GGDEF)-like protein
VVTRDEIQLTEAELQASRRRVAQQSLLMTFVGCIVVSIFTIPAAAIGDALADGWVRWAATAGAAFAMGVPAVGFASVLTRRMQATTAALMDSLRDELTDALTEAEDQAGRREAQARRQEFESRLANALEMADGEPEVIDVVQRAFDATLPGAPVELLLADNSHAHLSRMAVSSAVDGPLCGVDSPDRCPAARRAQVQHFPDSESLDACPKLRGRAGGACSATCIPVSIMGRTVGVIHATGDVKATVDPSAVQDLGTLANLSGARIGILRMVADTQLQAATDSLTGLLNRRSLEGRFLGLRDEVSTLAVVMADLDHFKALNDTYGHETGDRALRLFAQTLAGTLRSSDVVCRHGGEEFAVLLPGSTAAEAADALEQVRARLATAVAQAGLPPVTASFGVVDAEIREDLPAALARADAALFEAKRAGRDRVVVHGEDGPLAALEFVL